MSRGPREMQILTIVGVGLVHTGTTGVEKDGRGVGLQQCEAIAGCRAWSRLRGWWMQCERSSVTGPFPRKIAIFWWIPPFSLFI